MLDQSWQRGSSDHQLFSTTRQGQSVGVSRTGRHNVRASFGALTGWIWPRCSLHYSPWQLWSPCGPFVHWLEKKKKYCFISYQRWDMKGKRWQWLRNSVFTLKLHSKRRLYRHEIKNGVRHLHFPYSCILKSDVKVGLYNTSLHQKSQQLQLHEALWFEYKCYKVGRELEGVSLIQ